MSKSVFPEFINSEIQLKMQRTNERGKPRPRTWVYAHRIRLSNDLSIFIKNLSIYDFLLLRNVRAFRFNQRYSLNWFGVYWRLHRIIKFII